MAKTKIISSEPCEYREVLCTRDGYENFIKDEITYDQALADLDIFTYLLENAYSGYEDLKKKGFNGQSLKKDFFSNIENNIKTDDLLSFLDNRLKPYINDFHLSLVGKTKQVSYRYPIKVYFSNIFLLKNQNDFKVIKTDNSLINIGDIYRDSTQYLFIYPSEGKDVYRLGMLSKIDEQKNKTIELTFNEKLVTVLCNINNIQFHRPEDTSYKEISTDDSVYFYLPTLINPNKNWNNYEKYEEMYKKFTSLALRYTNKKNFIIDFRGNNGGSDLYCQKFMANLLFRERENSEFRNYKKFKKYMSFYSTNIYSPPILQAIKWETDNLSNEDKVYFNKLYKLMKKNNFNKIKIEYSKKGFRKKLDFSGNLIILTDKYTCSSGESFVYLANPLLEEGKNLFYVGENSAGCFNFGNVFCYQLPNSGIAVYLPSFKMKSGMIEECKGYMPDYWAYNEDLLQALVNITGDNELTEKLMNINNSL